MILAKHSTVKMTMKITCSRGTHFHTHQASGRAVSNVKILLGLTVVVCYNTGSCDDRSHFSTFLLKNEKIRSKEVLVENNQNKKKIDFFLFSRKWKNIQIMFDILFIYFPHVLKEGVPFNIYTLFFAFKQIENPN